MMFRPWLKNIPYDKRILEIGPLSWPNIQKNKYKNLFYADIRSTEDLKKFYKPDPNVLTNEIMDIDYVIENSYSESLKDVEKFDYVIATHVIEHMPQLVLFFIDIASVLKPGGKLCLAIPDKRFCFDHYRCPTSFAECYDIYKRKIINSPLRVFDHFINSSSNNNPTSWWQSPDCYDHFVKNESQYLFANNKYHQALNGDYIDVHFSVFTPETFLLFIYHMVQFCLLPFRCIEFYKTEINFNEFNCVLEFNNNVSINGSMENISEKANILKLLSANNDLSNYVNINYIINHNIDRLKHFLMKVKRKLINPIKRIINVICN